MRERYGIAVIVDVLRGMVGPKIVNDKLNKLTTYGIMREYSSKFIRDLIKGPPAYAKAGGLYLCCLNIFYILKKRRMHPLGFI